MIIGLTGYAQSGKDEVARILVEEYGFTRIAFADKIRELAYELNPIVEGYEDDGLIKPIYLREWVDEKGWDRAKVKEPEIRRILQSLGVACRKVFHENFWVIEAFKNFGTQDKNYVVTDVRFQNEAETIKRLTGDIWRVVRPGVGPVNTHISETELDSHEVDAKILNTGTLDDLHSIVQDLMESTLGNKTN